MNKVKVSACIITYNQEHYIKDCLDGAVSQVLDFDYEIVIGDDCSTDKTFQICKEYAERYPNKIKLLVRDKNKGMTGNWIDTILNCKGKYIALCEGDDYWISSNKLQKQVDFLESNPEYVLSFHRVNVLKRDGAITEDLITKVPENYESMEAMATFGNYIHTPSVVYRNIISEFPPEFELSPVCDYFLYMMLVQHGKVKYLKETMAVYRSDIGVMSKMSYIDVHYSEVRFYSCIASHLDDIKIKKIFIDRQLPALKKMERILNVNNKTYFIKKNKILKFALFLSDKYEKLVKRL